MNLSICCAMLKKVSVLGPNIMPTNSITFIVIVGSTFFELGPCMGGVIHVVFYPRRASYMQWLELSRWVTSSQVSSNLSAFAGRGLPWFIPFSNSTCVGTSITGCPLESLPHLSLELLMLVPSSSLSLYLSFSLFKTISHLQNSHSSHGHTRHSYLAICIMSNSSQVDKHCITPVSLLSLLVGHEARRSISLIRLYMCMGVQHLVNNSGCVALL